MKHLLSAIDFKAPFIEQILTRAGAFKTDIKKGKNVLKDVIVATVFHEPSTRTRMSFETAALRLGAQIISEANPQGSSATKGERIEDTIRIISSYSDILVLRQSDPDGANRAAAVSNCPVVNAGAGAGEHPTQSLIDLFTIHERFPITEKTIHVALVGDLKYGRTVHSLVQVLDRFANCIIRLIAPEELQMPEAYIPNNNCELSDGLTPEVLQWADVLYMTRVQKERFDNKKDYERLKAKYVLTPELVSHMKPDAMILHPLPKIDEIVPTVDALPQAHYFTQAANGVPVRMAILESLLD